ncbi:MAG: ABC transporter ATP-binding protein, partial [Bacillota bacterium]|nr:ABC transporter ATP-binding protein [Bacillota bacterium]
LDPRAVHTVKTWMQEYAAQGNIVFFSTHILEVAEKLVDRVGIIHHGELVAVGTLEELRQGEQGASLEHIFLALTEA